MFFYKANTSFNAIHENIILAKISELTVYAICVCQLRVKENHLYFELSVSDNNNYYMFY